MKFCDWAEHVGEAFHHDEHCIEEWASHWATEEEMHKMRHAVADCHCGPPPEGVHPFDKDHDNICEWGHDTWHAFDGDEWCMAHWVSHWASEEQMKNMHDDFVEHCHGEDDHDGTGDGHHGGDGHH